MGLFSFHLIPASQHGLLFYLEENNIQVIPPEEQTKEIQLFIANLIKNEVETVKEDTGQTSPF